MVGLFISQDIWSLLSDETKFELSKYRGPRNQIMSSSGPENCHFLILPRTINNQIDKIYDHFGQLIEFESLKQDSQELRELKKSLTTIKKSLGDL
jgi:hypothetical protein